MHSVSDLTTFARKTLGDVPPRLVGASTAVVGDKMYLFGGRLVTERRMVSDMYVFDLKTYIWAKVDNAEDPNLPGPRYFHSMDLWNNHLVVFGGMGYKAGALSVDDYCVLDDVRYYDISRARWLAATPTSDASIPFIPRARYAHLSSVSGSRLFIIGGQDLSNVWLDDIHVFDLTIQQWVHRRAYPRHCGTYRSVAVSSPWRVRQPQSEQGIHLSGQAGTRFRNPNAPVSQDQPACTSTEQLNHLPYSATPTPEFPSEVLLYSNYNFTDVKRELEIFTPIPDEDEFAINDRSASMGGNALPPGLRFPTGAVLGNHLILAGTYLASSYQSFSIWALDLTTMVWSRIDPGSTLASGSWCRALLWQNSNKFLIFGNRNGSLVDDYNRRLLTWDHVAYIDLEAFGIYQAPQLVLEIPAQELGLAAFEERVFADFEIVCDDERRIPCSRKVLEERWPWFREQRRLYLQAATEAVKGVSAPSASVPLPEAAAGPPDAEARPDPRLTPRMLRMAEPYPIVLAFVQYFYTQALITPLQHAPAVLSALLVLSSTYELPHLQSLVVHAMHRALSAATSVGVYEVATLCNCQSLQIRALKVVMVSGGRAPQFCLAGFCLRVFGRMLTLGPLAVVEQTTRRPLAAGPQRPFGPRLESAAGQQRVRAPPRHVRERTAARRREQLGTVGACGERRLENAFPPFPPSFPPNNTLLSCVILRRCFWIGIL
ncbi:galactose oxidase [Auricularia subglabra TFB-10046 SS5]|nr:galactose oxidase [Auricularia subglabra TFB-10046 SS5]